MKNESLPNSKSREAEPELYDFYYSDEQVKLINELRNENDENPILVPEYMIHGNPYIVMVKKGDKPTGNFNDYKLVFSGGKKKDIQKILD